MKDGKVVEPDNRYKLLNFNDEIYSLLIQNVEVNDTGRYTCWAHNKYGEAMTEAYLNVIGRSIEVRGQVTEVNDTGRYTCWAHNKYGEAMTEAYISLLGSTNYFVCLINQTLS